MRHLKPVELPQTISYVSSLPNLTLFSYFHPRRFSCTENSTSSHTIKENRSALLTKGLILQEHHM